MKREKQNNQLTFEKLAIVLTKFTGSTAALIIALSVILIWGISGPVFKYSEEWQLIINTGTTIITFLMVFLIQRAQNKDSLAIQLKLNELIAATQGASNRLVEVEDLTEKDLNILKIHYKQLAVLFAREYDLGKTHSVEEAQSRHNKKSQNKIK